MDERGRPSARRFINPFDHDDPPGHSRVVVVCPFCPRPWDDPPYRWFWMPHDVRAHLRRHKTHEVTFWCYGCRQLVEPGMTSARKLYPAITRDPLVRYLAADSGTPEGALQDAMDWRRREIERLQNEIAILEGLLHKRVWNGREAV